MAEERNENARYTVVVGKEAATRIGEIAKQFKISQGAVMEVLALNVRVDDFKEQLEERRRAKESSRGKQAKLLEQFKNLSPEQLAYLEKIGKAA